MSRRNVPTLAGVLFLASYVSITGARADDASIKKEADQRFQEAKTLLSQGDTKAACQKFEQSLALLKQPGTLLNLAVCREKEGLYATAMRLFQEAQSAAIADKRADREKLAREHIATLKPLVSWLEIKIAAVADVPGLVIKCDGHALPLADLGAPIAFDIGNHAISISAPGYKSIEMAAQIATPGEKKVIEIPALQKDLPEPPPTATAIVTPTSVPTLEPTATAAPTLIPTQAPSSIATVPNHHMVAPPAWKKPLGIALSAAGGVAIVVGAGFGLKAIADNNESKALCPNNVCINSTGVMFNQDAKTAALVADVAFPVGIVAAGAGLFLLLTAKPTLASQQSSTQSSPTATVIPIASPTHGGFVVRGAF